MLARGLLRSSAAFEVCPKMASSKMSSSSADTRAHELQVSDTNAHASIKNVDQEGIKKEDSNAVKLRKEIQTALETIAMENTRMGQMELRQCEYTMEMDAAYRNSQDLMTVSRVELTKPANVQEKKPSEKKLETASESESESS